MGILRSGWVRRFLGKGTEHPRKEPPRQPKGIHTDNLGEKKDRFASAEQVNFDEVPIVELGDSGRAWRVTPSLPVGGLQVHDTVADEACWENLVIRGASVRGTRNRHSRRPRQDHYYLRDNSDWLVLALADGVSSAQASHLGAQRATHIATDLLMERCCSIPTKREIRGEDWLAILRHVREQFLAMQSRVGDDLGGPECGEPSGRDLATTLTIVAIARTETPKYPCFILQWGDSDVWKLREHHWSQVKIAAQKRESGFMQMKTDALPYVPKDIGTVVAQETIAPGEALFLTTDEVSGVLQHANSINTVARQLSALWKCPPSGLDFASQVGFRLRGFGDDRTCLGVWHPT